MRLKNLLSLLLILFLLPTKLYAQLPPGQLEQDCINALPICQDLFTQSQTYTDGGKDNNELPSGLCLTRGESNSVWYVFTTNSAGTLQFDIDPTGNDDYDFALFDITGASCGDIKTGVAPAVRCNYASSVGTGTGILPGHPTSGSDAYLAPLTVTANQTFALLISNFSSSANGYTINFVGSTTSIIANTQSQLVTADPSTCDTTSKIFVYFSKPVLSSTIASDGSDFSITGPSTVSVTSAKSTTVGRYTTKIELGLASPIYTPGTYAIGVKTGTDGNSVNDICSNPVSLTTINYTQLAVFVPEFAATSIPGCNIDTAIFTNNTLGVSNVTSYLWDFGDGTTSNDPGPIKHIYPAVGQYTVTLTENSVDCSKSIQHPITIAKTPFKTGFTTTPTTPCAGDAVQFTDTSAVFATQWLWTFGDGAISADQNPVHTFAAPGTYNVQFEMTDATGTCMATVTNHPVTVTTLAAADFTTIPALVCQGLPIVFQDASVGQPTSWSWDFGNGKTSNLQNFSLTYDSVGIFNVKLKVTSQCNADSITKVVTVKKTPRFELGNDTAFCKSDSLKLVAYKGADNTTWSTGQTGDSIYFKDPVLSPGTDINVVSTLDGCSFDATIHIDAQEDGCIEIHLPTAFTPNGDGNNDKFRLVHPDRVQAVDIKIYNRWGQLVFSDNVVDFRWDGTFKNEKAPADVYSWYLLATGLSGQNEFYKGNVTIIR